MFDSKIWQCEECLQPYSPKYMGYQGYERWCNCNTKKFLDESKSVEYHKKPNELSEYERLGFKKFGFCHNCNKLKMNDKCDDCKDLLIVKYGRCDKCLRPYTPEESYEKWCDICDSKQFLKASIAVEYFKQPIELTKSYKCR